jgi:hypothetical protein
MKTMNGWTGSNDVKQEEGGEKKNSYNLLGKNVLFLEFKEFVF